MKYTAKQYGKASDPAVSSSQRSADMNCDWQALRVQLLLQWPQLSPADLDKIGPDRHRLAMLIERKYQISSQVIENYLCNFERTLPIAG